MCAEGLCVREWTCVWVGVGVDVGVLHRSSLIAQLCSSPIPAQDEQADPILAVSVSELTGPVLGEVSSVRLARGRCTPSSIQLGLYCQGETTNAAFFYAFTLDGGKITYQQLSMYCIDKVSVCVCVCVCCVVCVCACPTTTVTLGSTRLHSSTFLDGIGS